MKAYMFDVDIATIYGVDNAVMIWNLCHWIDHNAANEKNFYNGRYWTFNSIEAFTKQFPFWSKGQIRRILKSLEDSDVIMTGNFNADRRDRSTWYAFTDSFQQMHLSKSTNANVEIDKSLDINNISNTNVNTNIPADGGLFGDMPADTKERKQRKTSESMCLFANSRYNDYELFATEFAAPDFAKIDIAYYYHAVADWSSSLNKKRTDWIATARNFIRKDREANKVHTVGGVAGGLSADAVKYLYDMADGN